MLPLMRALPAKICSSGLSFRAGSSSALPLCRLDMSFPISDLPMSDASGGSFSKEPIVVDEDGSTSSFVVG